MHTLSHKNSLIYLHLRYLVYKRIRQNRRHRLASAERIGKVLSSIAEVSLLPPVAPIQKVTGQVLTKLDSPNQSKHEWKIERNIFYSI